MILSGNLPDGKRSSGFMSRPKRRRASIIPDRPIFEIGEHRAKFLFDVSWRNEPTRGAQGRFPDTAAIVKQVAEAVQYAHSGELSIATSSRRTCCSMATGSPASPILDSPNR
jgi:hypothetical protein